MGAWSEEYLVQIQPDEGILSARETNEDVLLLGTHNLDYCTAQGDRDHSRSLDARFHGPDCGLDHEGRTREERQMVQLEGPFPSCTAGAHIGSRDELDNRLGSQAWYCTHFYRSQAGFGRLACPVERCSEGCSQEWLAWIEHSTRYRWESG